MLISIIVPHYEDLERLDTLLNMLQAQTVSSDQYEIVVADNMSPSGEAAVAARIAGRAKLVTCHERGAGPTRNAGVAASTLPLLAFIDSDCQPEPGWLAAGLAALEHADLVGGKMKVLVDQPGQRTGAEAVEQVFAFDNRTYVTTKGFSVTANLFTRRDVFAKVGGFRTQVSEDVEWCKRATAAGYRLSYEERAVVAHPARRNWSELKHKWQRLQRESLALSSEQAGGRAKWLLRNWAALASTPLHLGKIWRSDQLDNVAERRAASTTLVRLRLWRFLDAHKLVYGGR